MFQSCLICTDFTDGLYRFIDCVPSLAQCGLNKIIFFHSVPFWEEGEVPRIDEEKVEQANQRLQKALENIPSSVEVVVEVLSGKPLDTIPRILKKHSVDVIMTGTPIKSLLQEKFFGSTSAGLAKVTTQPLNIIRPELITTYTREELALRCQHLWRYLLIPYNNSETARYLIEEIKKYAKDRPENSLKQCMLMSVVDDCGRKSVLAEQRTKEAETSLGSVKAQLEELGIEVNTLVKTGNPLQEIITAALDFDISAIAIATDYRNSLLQWTVRSFANDVMRSSWFPVLLFSPKK
ncbi:universal stress protein [Waterburya agarophytonicola K14]|uniref:Universal stress protein n=1 Tax=Waterburya agarophytonicola KI4 TaxID=2874699 RepID=A0A964BMB8_9CYAN|nr:universal stress protein [Waterburya agarophytonicola]MCC0175983.1 universal stress protein [Waterburya agarophytonicola KI4]